MRVTADRKAAVCDHRSNSPLRFTWLNAVTRAWNDYRRVALRRRSVRAALRAFAATHPEWAAALWDEAFVRRLDAVAAIEARDALALARAWTRQFAYRDERRREHDVRRAAEPAREFLRLVADAGGAMGPAAADRERGGPWIT